MEMARRTPVAQCLRKIIEDKPSRDSRVMATVVLEHQKPIHDLEQRKAILVPEHPKPILDLEQRTITPVSLARTFHDPERSQELR